MHLMQCMVIDVAQWYSSAPLLKCTQTQVRTHGIRRGKAYAVVFASKNLTASTSYAMHLMRCVVADNTRCYKNSPCQAGDDDAQCYEYAPNFFNGHISLLISVSVL